MSASLLGFHYGRRTIKRSGQLSNVSLNQAIDHLAYSVGPTVITIVMSHYNDYNDSLSTTDNVASSSCVVASYNWNIDHLINRPVESFSN